ncbi:DUF924 family protein [Devosia sp. FKR38]|uniref:DUF924 family protein n=1 Tax=Devosia sp. FKR38 TaxID=2562312 RepID=UPI0010C12EA1|nr:DUF924 family protein [Devosia sp. FKR38]
MQTPDAIMDFWFVAHGQDDWFSGDAAFDARIAERFALTHRQVAAGEAWTWRVTPQGRLAEIIVLDQFSRQLYRGSATAFARDCMALALAQEAIAAKADADLSSDQRMFLYMPFMHSESLVIQDEGVRLFAANGDDKALDFMFKHRDCVARFGRFPKRNAALGRTSTPEEQAYIEDIGDRMF